ncbi:MAG: hypothetical protein GF330_04545 [Candidatus Eisenbacteria bacterium]|nr:hypothetical protein [Candidatus Eisenbacteria bacterium]
MAHAAVSDGSIKYGKVHYIIRSRLHAGLRRGTMHVGSVADDERLKMILPSACCYCGVREGLSLDHLLPKSKGGPDKGDNIVWACRSCNSSKGGRDVLEWLAGEGRFPPLLLLRRYLKLAIEFCESNGHMEAALDDADGQPWAFSVRAIPRKVPPPCDLVLWQAPLEAE